MPSRAHIVRGTQYTSLNFAPRLPLLLEYRNLFFSTKCAKIRATRQVSCRMTRLPRLCRQSTRHQDLESRKGKLIETQSGKPWTVPLEGYYLISFQASRFPGSELNVETDEGLEALMQNIQSVSSAARLHSTSRTHSCHESWGAVTKQSRENIPLTTPLMSDHQRILTDFEALKSPRYYLYVNHSSKQEPNACECSRTPR